MIKFSVIIISYNHASFLEERIVSILNQTYPHYEIIFFDDASTDNSQSVIERYRHHSKVTHLLLNKVNSGFQSRNWQQAIELAKYDWIWIAEGDDVAEPEFLEKAAASLSHNKEVLLYSNAYKLETGKGRTGSKLYSRIKDSFFQTQHWLTNYFEEGKTELDRFHKYVCIINNVSSAIFPRQPALEVLAQFPHKRFHNDWLFFALLMEKFPVQYLSEPLTGYRYHPGSHFSVSGNELEKRIECFEILQYFFKQNYISNKNDLARFYTEQYLGFGLWKHISWIPTLGSAFFKQNPRLAILFFYYLFLLKLSRKKVKYIF